MTDNQKSADEALADEWAAALEEQDADGGDGTAAAHFEELHPDSGGRNGGDVKIDVNQTFPLRDVRAAHEALEGRKTTGATVLLP